MEKEKVRAAQAERPLRRVVLTGATGVIGRALLAACREAGIETLVLTHPGSARAAQLPCDSLTRLAEADLDEYAGLPDRLAAAAPYDAFFHLAWKGTFGAARNDMELQTGNIRGALAAVRLAAALGCRTFVGVGSQAEYGRADGVLRPDTPVHPENGYGMAKLCAGQMTRTLAQSLGLAHVWLRVLSVYGPHDGAQTLISTALRQMIAGEETAFTAGEQLWDYLYSGDAALALLLAAPAGGTARSTASAAVRRGRWPSICKASPA